MRRKKANVIDLVYGMIVYKKITLDDVYEWTNDVICYIVNCILMYISHFSYRHGFVETFYGFSYSLSTNTFRGLTNI